MRVQQRKWREMLLKSSVTARKYKESDGRDTSGGRDDMIFPFCRPVVLFKEKLCNGQSFCSTT